MRVAVTLMLLAGVACADAPGRVRQATYPPDFQYFERGEVQGVMGQLAVQIVALDELMRKPQRTAEDQEAIVEILTTMQALAGNLTKGTRSTHARIDRAAPMLQRDLARALREAQQSPPNYYFAGEVVGACTYCHVPRHDPVRRRPPPEEPTQPQG